MIRSLRRKSTIRSFSRKPSLGMLDIIDVCQKRYCGTNGYEEGSHAQFDPELNLMENYLHELGHLCDLGKLHRAAVAHHAGIWDLVGDLIRESYRWNKRGGDLHEARVLAIEIEAAKLLGHPLNTRELVGYAIDNGNASTVRDLPQVVRKYLGMRSTKQKALQLAKHIRNIVADIELE